MKKQPEGKGTENGISLSKAIQFVFLTGFAVYFIVSLRQNATGQKIKVTKKINF